MGRSLFLTLPAEVIEAILICSCSPRTVASAAQTCRTLHTLIYTSPDSHLWRELFLTTWDDPRPALEHRALLDPRIDPAAWDWGTEYRRRVTADRWLKTWRRDICLADEKAPMEDTNWRTAALSTLSAVLDTLFTLRPFPPSPLTVLSPTIPPYPMGNAGSGVGDRRERMSNAPPLPPLLIMLACGFSDVPVSRSGLRVARMAYGPHASHALVNKGEEPAQWTLMASPSLPPQLVRTLLALRAVGVRGLPPFVPSLSATDCWGVDDALGDVFHRIICITGFVPVPPPLDSILTSTAGSVQDRKPTPCEDVNHDQDSDSDEETQTSGQSHAENPRPESDKPTDGVPKPFPTPSQQHADARILARRRVYDMQYLRGDRLWGPFQPVTKESLNSRPRPSLSDIDSKAKGQKKETRPSTNSTASRTRGLHGLQTLAWAMDVENLLENELGDPDSTSDDDSGDEEWYDPSEAVPEVSTSSRGSQGTEDADRILETEPEQSLVSLSFDSMPTSTVDLQPTTSPTLTDSRSSRRRTRRSNPRLPHNCNVSPRSIKPEHLRPDYVYLASVRIVVEENLRELLGIEISDVVEGTIAETRVGGVGMFWGDEDEILQAQAGPSGQASHASPSLTTTRGGNPTASTNSRNLELADILSMFRNLEVARLGSACGYWPGWMERQLSETKNIDQNASTSGPSSKGKRKPRVVTQRNELEKPIEVISATRHKGKGKGIAPDVAPADGNGLGDWEIGPEDEACEGWDWAGVTGVWRRCVCWMDYRELLFFNLDTTKFITIGMQEACRIIPMELRITGYTRAGLMPIYDTEDDISVSPIKKQPKTCVRFFRPPPVIHFSGSSIGSDSGLDDGRSVKGRVQLIGGGEVRWELDTYPQNSTLPRSSKPEWASEAVQVGGIGSTVGLLGMWTGSRHERADPLGPFWAWKVG